MTHIFLSSLVLAKDTETGEWQLAEVDTNKGRFLLGAETNEKLTQETIDKFVHYVRNKINSDIIGFLEQEGEQSVDNV